MMDVDFEAKTCPEAYLQECLTALQAQLSKELHAHGETGKALQGLQDKLAERDKESVEHSGVIALRDKEIADLKHRVLEQQAWVEEMNSALGLPKVRGNALESALNAERAKTLEAAIQICNRQAALYCDEGGNAGTCSMLIEELKEGK